MKDKNKCAGGRERMDLILEREKNEDRGERKGEEILVREREREP